MILISVASLENNCGESGLICSCSSFIFAKRRVPAIFSASGPKLRRTSGIRGPSQSVVRVPFLDPGDEHHPTSSLATGMCQSMIRSTSSSEIASTSGVNDRKMPITRSLISP